MTGLWLRGLLRRRPGRLVASALGVATAVALLASLGAFLAHSKATMTSRAVNGTAVDWQVQVQPGHAASDIQQLLSTTAHVVSAVEVDFGATDGLSTQTQGSTQTTGAGIVVGLGAGYADAFPGELRLLTGSLDGALLAQQTAANLHAGPGDTVTIARAGLSPVSVRISGVVDLPFADSLFQSVGAGSGTQRPAPPDNVLLLPASQWRQDFSALAVTRPDLVTVQFHVATDRSLPVDPAVAYAAAVAAANNVLARSAGAATLGNNLAATLDAARKDAAYAQVLFLFLGLPGAILAGLLTGVIAESGVERRRREQALLRARGATSRQLTALAAVEAATVGLVGSAVGLGVGALVGATAFGSAAFGATAAAALGWAGAAAAAGMVIAAATILIPARRDLRRTTVAASRRRLDPRPSPRWARYGLDVLLLIAAALVFAATSRDGYQLVVAPEGVPTLSISYWAFAGPALLWSGGGLLAWRISDLVLGPGRRAVAGALRPATGRLSATIAATIARTRRPLIRAVVLLALAVSFAVSTAVFNATYRQQAEVDAQLTNGADVVATPVPGVPTPAALAERLARVPGVRAVEPIQHRFAYIGPDLQDLYGISPTTITRATALQDSYFQGGSTPDLLRLLATQPDAILVSAETVKDYQLSPGDSITLRLLQAGGGQQVSVRFHYVGIVTEFPTAPKDSFFVANSDYIARQTGNDSIGAYLIDTGGRRTATVAADVTRMLGATAVVTDINTVRKSVGSSLTSVDLDGLTRIELTFALILAVGCGGLVFLLGLAERRRSLAIATALGARPRHLRAIVLAEALVVAVGGLVAGTLIGMTLSSVIIKVLAGVFDPPPSSAAVPWTYLAATGTLALTALLSVAAIAVQVARKPAIAVLREL